MVEGQSQNVGTATVGTLNQAPDVNPANGLPHMVLQENRAMTDPRKEFKIAEQEPFTKRPDFTAALMFAENDFQAQPDQIAAKMADPEKAFDMKTYQAISVLERQQSMAANDGTVAKSDADWKTSYAKWNMLASSNAEGKRALDQIYKAMGVAGELNDQALDQILAKYNDGAEGTGMETFVKEIASLGELDDASMGYVQGIAKRLFGTRLSGQVAANIAEFRGRVQAAGADAEKIKAIGAEIETAAKTPSDETKKQANQLAQLKAQIPKQAEVPPGTVPVEKKDETPELKADVLNKVEGDPLPANIGAALIGERGVKSADGDPRGQDRLSYHKLANGAEVMTNNDGAGPEGHTVAEKMGARFAEELNKLKVEELVPDRIKQIVLALHQEAQALGNSKSGAGLDAIIRLPNGKKYAIHVGEGFVGRIRTADEIKAKAGPIIEALAQPHQFGMVQETDAAGNGVTENGQPKMVPKRTPNGFKTAELGVDAPVTVDVAEFTGIGVAGSDGFSELMEKYQLNSEAFLKLLQDNPAEAARQLAQMADTWQRQQAAFYNAAHPNGGPGDISKADDVSVAVVA